ncbi:MAG: serine hydroxymethyltransferase [Bacteroidia bacterium]|nr:serine hydroxymethyltransferase [Bacteroidia bacterium]MDW8133990.1 serine hydroxymethyltransferase [Bacteroidia bacterium]
MIDPIFGWIEAERRRQEEGLELIASENYASPAVLAALGSVLTNKYAEGLPGRRYYGGCEYVDEVERIAQERLKTLFGAEWVNVQPHSGAQANEAVLLALLKPGQKILSFELAHGGHLTHGSPLNSSGRLYNVRHYGVRSDTYLLDYDQIHEKAREFRPAVLMAGASSYPRDWDWTALRSIADEVGAILVADIAHPAGLIAAGLLNNPLPHCHIVTSTTHKTLRGPRGGIIMMGKDFDNPFGELTPKGTPKKMSALLDTAVFPGVQGGPHMHVIAAKAVAFGEALQPAFREYSRQVIRNAQALADSLKERGYTILTGGTDNHIVLVDLRNKNITGREAEKVLEKAGITVNKNLIPYDPQPPLIASGIRLGTPALTTRGMNESDMRQIAAWIDEALTSASDETHLKRLKDTIREYLRAYPLPYAPAAPTPLTHDFASAG